ncbi:DUF1778 domain-containing protein [Xanthomonas phaseoli pv. dieffenbachiae]|nr:DUF1778 domain-containing protein [Xanthomonas phaseoli pv. manihotis str. CIO151]
MSTRAAQRFQQFTALLDAPQDANPSLERLMAITAPWSTSKAWGCSFQHPSH